MTFLPPELVAVVGVPVVVMTCLFAPIPLYLPADGGGQITITSATRKK